MNDVERTVPIRRPAAPGLPRRRSQAHLEPQLREPGSSGTGTPFLAFVPGAVPGGAGDARQEADETVAQPAVAQPTLAQPTLAQPVSEDAEPGARRAGAGARAAVFRAAARAGARVEAQHQS